MDTPYSPTEKLDVVIRGGLVVDGSGCPGYLADVGTQGKRIVRVTAPGQLNNPSRLEIDARGKVVAPGFIDSHAHDDSAALEQPEMRAKISQGVTTVVTGNCGISLAPFTGKAIKSPLDILGELESFRFPTVSDYRNAVAASRPSTNLALLVGHSTLRISRVKDLNRRANADELKAMRQDLDLALQQGAVGLSTGTYYKPSAAADEAEIIALAELLAAHRGVYATHMRDEFDGVARSLVDSFATAAAANCPLVISHHKCAGPENWGRSLETLPMLEHASEHQPVGFDVYPYRAGSTILDPDFVDERYHIIVSWSRDFPQVAGCALKAIAEEWQVDQQTAARRLQPATAIYFSMSEEDVRRIVAHPMSMIGSDGLWRGPHPHPRLWGTFPRVLGHYCRQEKLLSLESAVHKMTGLTAQRFSLTDRGFVREGLFADVVVFDANTVQDTATFADPQQPALGIEHVFVNGVLSWNKGAATGERGGTFLSRQE